MGKSVLQDWVSELTFMQQSVLLTAVRGPDGVPKYHPSKYIIRWFRRAILISSFARCAILNPYEPDGGSFYGPSCNKHPLHDRWEEMLEPRASDYLKALDELPHHFQMHVMHAAEIVERECRRCGMVKVTRHEAEGPKDLHWVEWWRDEEQINSGLTPPCDARCEVAA